jgi:hypothetical protein
MRQQRMRIVVIALLALGAALGLTACGGDDGETTAAPGTTAAERPPDEAKAGNTDSDANGDSATTTIVVRDGKPVDGVRQLEYDAGEQVRFAVRSNTPDEVHIHGYDVTTRLPAGKTVPISFPAAIEGIFEVELHGGETQIAELRVNP